MKKFSAYKHPNGNIAVVKQGWSWPSFFFGGWYLLYKRLWAESALWWGLFLLLVILSIPVPVPMSNSIFSTIVEWATYTITLIAWFYLFFAQAANTNERIERNLVRRGYRYDRRVVASSAKVATRIIETAIPCGGGYK